MKNLFNFPQGLQLKSLELISVIGLSISVYAIYVENKKTQDESYQALCDIGEKISCSAVLTSEWSHLFSTIGLFKKDSILDQSNAVYGFLFYLTVNLFAVIPS